MTEEKKVDEKKVEKKSAAAAAAPVKTDQPKKSSLPLIAIILVCLMAVAVIFVFLNSQKLDKKVFDLSRKLTTLQSEEKEVGQRVLALEDELVVMGLKHRLNKIKLSCKNLEALKNVLSDNPEMVKKVQDLVDELGVEQRRLQGEIGGNVHKKFKATRRAGHGLAMSSMAPAGYQCCPESGKCILLPQVENNHPQGHVTPAPASVIAAHAAPKAVPAAAEPQSGWARFVNTRIFGN